MVEQFRGVVLDKAVSLSAALKLSLWQRHRRVKKPSICERYCGVRRMWPMRRPKAFRVQPFPSTSNTCGAHVFLFQLFISLSRLEGLRWRPTISSHHADTKSHAPPEKYILGVCTCVLCVDMTRDAMINTGGERNRV